MRLLDLMKKHLAPTVLGIITFDGYRRSVITQNKELTELKNLNNEQLSDLQKQLWDEKLVTSDFKLTLEATSSKIESLELDIFKVKSNLNNIDLQINSKSFNIGENIDSLNNKQKYYSDELNILNNQKDSCVTELLNKINEMSKSDISNFLSDLIEKSSISLSFRIISSSLASPFFSISKNLIERSGSIKKLVSFTSSERNSIPLSVSSTV